MQYDPLVLTPVLHVKVWGGRKLETVLGKSLPTAAPYGEAWELHETATIANGDHVGKTLGAIIAEDAVGILGAAVDASAGLPLLVKLLDASDWLSVQVHPNDEQARRLEGEPRGKTEAWIILAAADGAELVIGVQPGIQRDALAESLRTDTVQSVLVRHPVRAGDVLFIPAGTVHAIGPGILLYEVQPGIQRAALAESLRTDTVQSVLVRHPVRAGDVLFIPAGTVHAIGPGILLYEVQQTSDTTYRLYDWGRMGLDGKPRPLHIEKGVQVSNVESLPRIRTTADDPAPTVTMVACPYFETERHRINAVGMDFDTRGERFHCITTIDGMVQIGAGGTLTPLPLGQTALIPAALGAYRLVGTGAVLRSWVV